MVAQTKVEGVEKRSVVPRYILEIDLALFVR